VVQISAFPLSLNAYTPFELSDSNIPKVFGFEIIQQNQQLIWRAAATPSFHGTCSLEVVFDPTAPTNHLPDWSGLNKFARGQKGADKPIDPVLVR